jgi:hypothetical protein
MSVATDRLMLKVKRADKHILELQNALLSFKASNPHRFSAKRDPQTRKLHYYVESMQPVPEEIALICGDILHNLRNALDHLVCRLVEIGDGAKAITTSTAFPAFLTPDKYKAGRDGKVKGMRPEAIKAIDELEPYEGGAGDILWHLHKLNIVDKHRLIFTVGMAPTEMNVGKHLGAKHMAELLKAKNLDPADFPDFPNVYAPFPERKPLKVGDDLYISEPDAEVDENLEFLLDVAFAESGVAEGESILETVQKMADVVEGIISSFEPLLI